ncbi:COX15/CtaA family protein [Promicromonospora iranensis]|uniref:Cytochrome c oxidase assembly protein subunit 15 n=1 Tax=Promicromonospora iranensis TaxID=1105144 RepID=A0ABU2CIW0_9MICO|nr:COX15/CtaA family protein [Promicromonospora iranensis]MDR7381285.1 cytochrome c oxidase assembly protein subunit 15 [Promicromonospora iranensis]
MTATAAPTSRLAALAGRVDRFRHWTRAVLIANLVGQIGIIGTGGAVRLTGSGLGCSTWPNCEPGQFTPQFHEATSLHPYIEFGNRTLTGVLGIIAVLVAIAVCTDLKRSASYRLLGLVPIVGVLMQALIGGVVVLLHLHPGWVSLHFGVSGALVAASLYLLHRSGEGDNVPTLVVGPRVRALAWTLAGLTAVVVVLGVLTTGAGPHSGDAEVGYRIAVDPALLTRWHAVAVWAFLAVLVAYLVSVRGGPAPVRRAALILLVITLAQGLIGYVQYFTDLPELLVGLHMIGAAVLIAGTTRVVLTTRVR